MLAQGCIRQRSLCKSVDPLTEHPVLRRRIPCLKGLLKAGKGFLSSPSTELRTGAAEPRRGVGEVSSSGQGALEKHFKTTAKPLPALQTGDHVLLQYPTKQRWATTGVIVEVGPNRDRLIKTVGTEEYRKNT